MLSNSWLVILSPEYSRGERIWVPGRGREIPSLTTPQTGHTLGMTRGGGGGCHSESRVLSGRKNPGSRGGGGDSVAYQPEAPAIRSE
jgi:hypothetical protein